MGSTLLNTLPPPVGEVHPWEALRRQEFQEAEEQFPDNEIVTSRYSWVTFIPVNLWEQFHILTYVYYLVVSILQVWRGPGSVWSGWMRRNTVGARPGGRCRLGLLTRWVMRSWAGLVRWRRTIWKPSEGIRRPMERGNKPVPASLKLPKRQPKTCGPVRLDQGDPALRLR